MRKWVRGTRMSLALAEYNGDSWTVSSTVSQSGCSDGGLTTRYSNLSPYSPAGDGYPLPTLDYVASETGGSSCVRTLTDYTVNGGLKVTVSSSGALTNLTFPNGQVYNSHLSDPFGNSISFSSGVYTDTLGNPAISASEWLYLQLSRHWYGVQVGCASVVFQNCAD